MIWVFQFDEQSFDPDNSFAIVIYTFPKSEEQLSQHSCQWLFITRFILQINPAIMKAGDISIDSGCILLNTTW